jgi:hypothetical protein
MQSLAWQIEEDRRTRIGLMQRMGTPKSAVKEAGAWVTEKASRAKFAGIATRMQVSARVEADCVCADPTEAEVSSLIGGFLTLPFVRGCSSEGRGTFLRLASEAPGWRV